MVNNCFVSDFSFLNFVKKKRKRPPNVAYAVQQCMEGGKNKIFCLRDVWLSPCLAVRASEQALQNFIYRPIRLQLLPIKFCRTRCYGCCGVNSPWLKVGRVRNRRGTIR